MDRTFSNEQLCTVKYLMDLQMEIDNRIRNKIQEYFLRESMDNEELNEQLTSLKDSLEYILDEKFRLMSMKYL